MNYENEHFAVVKFALSLFAACDQAVVLVLSIVMKQDCALQSAVAWFIQMFNVSRAPLLKCSRKAACGFALSNFGQKNVFCLLLKPCQQKVVPKRSRANGFQLERFDFANNLPCM